MKKDNASISNTGEEKVMSIAEENKMSDHKATDQPLEPKKNTNNETNESVSCDEDVEIEELKADIRELLSGLSEDLHMDDDRREHGIEHMRDMAIRRAMLDSVEGNPCIVKHGHITKNIKSFKEKTSFSVKNGEATFDISINSETIIQVASCDKGHEVYAIGSSIHDKFVAKIVCTHDFYKMFDSVVDIKEKFILMKKFLGLASGQKKNIAQQLSGKKYGIKTDEDVVRFTKLDELRLKFDICRETYTHQQQRDIENLFAECSGVMKPGKSLLKLKYILNITPTTSAKSVPNRNSIMETLNKRLYKLDKVKTEIVEAIIASKYTQNHGLRLLLVGSPGTGKTTIIKAIAEAYGLPYDVIHLNGTNSALEIKGTDSSYDGSDAGKLVKSFYQLGITEAVIGLDEIDKMASGGKDGNPADALLDTLSDEYVCYDAFLETGIDTHNTVYIATANSTNGIPEFLLNRFKVIMVDDYDDDDKVVIAQEYVIPQLLKTYDLSKTDIVFPTDVLLYMVKRFCSDNGVRGLKEGVHSIIRMIINCWDEAGKRTSVVVDSEMVNNRLEPIADTSNVQLRYHRNKELFSENVRDEIKKGLTLLLTSNLNPHEKATVTRRLEYLTSIIPEKGGFEAFDKDAFFDCVSSTHFGLLSVKEKIAKSFYSKALKKRSFSSERILLAGGPGIGKSSICKSIAKGLGIPYVKISLNGVADTHMLKGFEPTWQDSDAGVIVRELAKAGTTKVLVQLDEVDKLGKMNGVNVSNALIDLLDNSSEFTDVFLEVPLDLSNVLFIATANDLSSMEPWLLDRFSIIQLDGYTYADKEQILDKYLLPKLDAEYAEAGIKFSITNEAKSILLKDYCTSFGVRDLEKAVDRIVNDKLYRTMDADHVCIDANDVFVSLGPKPIPRGNLLKKNVPGFSKALAVSGNNSGMSFSIESAIIPSDNSTCITGLPKESAIDSVKLAKTYIRTHFLPDNEDFGVHLHFGEGAVVKDGPSAGVAIMVSMLSAVFNMPVEGNVAYTGEIDLFGNVFAIGGTLTKIQAAEQSGCSKVFIPRDNYDQLSKEETEQFAVEIIPVDHVNEVINTVLPRIHDESRYLNH